MSRISSHGTLISEPDGTGEVEAAPTVPAGAAVLHASSAPSRSLSGLESGELLSSRFRVEELIQSGGMGDVYRATDIVEDQVVAIKVLRAGSAGVRRFAREAERLKELAHPAIPRYVFHDLEAPQGPYLAMEWLDGETLAEHLRRHRLGLRTCIDLVQQVAEALSAAHGQGVVHRDINPSNIFLVNKSPQNVRVLDFGVSRLEGDESPLTAEGAQIGTPGYMSPEQIEGSNDVGPTADVFALGCVFYEIVCGQRPFLAPTVKELLTRILTEEPHAPGELNSLVGPEMERLILRMLSKAPSGRPHDAQDVLALLATLPTTDDSLDSTARPSQSGHSVQGVSSVIVFRDGPGGLLERATQVCVPLGMRVHPGANSTIVVATQGRGTPSDHALRAARGALALQRSLRVPLMAVSTGLYQHGGDVPSGRAFDAALVNLLIKSDGEAASTAGATLWLDETTATLLDSRFEVRQVEQGYLLRGLRDTYEPARTVLGRRTRCVGRKRELTMLQATLSECFEDGVSGAVLITGAAGVGKTRLASEVARLARRDFAHIEVLRGSSDAITAGTPLFSVVQAILRSCRVRDQDNDKLRSKKLRQRLEQSLSGADLERVLAFLGELLGIADSSLDHPQVRAARGDRVLWGDQVIRALEDWLHAECSRGPLLLILDDFHWGDLATVKLVDALLRHLAEQPLVVLCLARPEVHELFPKLWSRRGLTELRLGGLSRRAASTMIEEILGEGVQRQVLDRVIQRAQGNPFWIEELLRAEKSGHGENIPDRVVLLAQSRIEQLRPLERQILEAASVFGRRFRLSGVHEIIGPQRTRSEVSRAMVDLVEAEFVVRQDGTSQVDELEFEFASGLLRDAAYSLIESHEKEEAHRRAAQWLEKGREGEPLVIAMHFSLGGAQERARIHYLHAAEQALSGDDMESAVSCAEEGLSTGAGGEEAVRLYLTHAEANKWRGDHAAALKSARKALEYAEPQSDAHFKALAEAVVAAGKLGNKQLAGELASELLGLDAESLTDEQIVALSRAATQLTLLGSVSQAHTLLARADLSPQMVQPDPRVLGYISEARALLAGAEDDPLGRILFAEQAVQYFEEAGDLRNACLLRLSQGFAEVEFGLNEQAVGTLERAIALAERMGLENSLPVGDAQLGRALTRLRDWDRAATHLERAAGTFDRQKNVRLAGMCRLYQAELQLAQGHLEDAIELARRGYAILQPVPAMKRIADALLAAMYAELGDKDVACTHAQEAIAGLSKSTRLPFSETLVRVAAASGLCSTEQRHSMLQMLAAERERVMTVLERRGGEGGGSDAEYLEGYQHGCPARRYLLSVLTDEQTTAPEINYARYVMQEATTVGLSTAIERDYVTHEQVERIANWPEPVLRNLWITQSYHKLSRDLAAVIDATNVNWSTFACWASKTAGQSIRSEELPRFVEKELGIDQQELRNVSSRATRLLEAFGLGRLLRAAALETLRHVSEQIAAGNLRVYAELAPLFARYAELLRKDPKQSELDAFLAELRSGPVDRDGQEYLKTAFQAWYDVTQTGSARERAQIMLRANCLIGLHEQTRLQQNIKAAMDAPIETLLVERFKKRLPRLFGGLIAKFATLVGRGFIAALSDVWERVATRYAMNLALPSGKEISLHADLPNRPDTFPPDLREITDPKTLAVVQRFDAQLGSTAQSGANNWADLNDRMGFIVELFRSQQQNRELFDAPFSPEQETELSAGKVPSGSL